MTESKAYLISKLAIGDQSAMKCSDFIEINQSCLSCCYPFSCKEKRLNCPATNTCSVMLSVLSCAPSLPHIGAASILFRFLRADWKSMLPSMLLSNRGQLLQTVPLHTASLQRSCLPCNASLVQVCRPMQAA